MPCIEAIDDFFIFKLPSILKTVYHFSGRDNMTFISSISEFVLLTFNTVLQAQVQTWHAV